MEVEEEGKKSKRLEQEQKDQEELNNVMNDMDLTWEQKKTRERELQERKRSRNQGAEEEVGSKPKRSRRMEYDLLGEDWGSEDMEDKGTYVEPGEQANYDPPDPPTPIP